MTIRRPQPPAPGTRLYHFPKAPGIDPKTPRWHGDPWATDERSLSVQIRVETDALREAFLRVGRSALNAGESIRAAGMAYATGMVRAVDVADARRRSLHSLAVSVDAARNEPWHFEISGKPVDIYKRADVTPIPADDWVDVVRGIRRRADGTLIWPERSGLEGQTPDAWSMCSSCLSTYARRWGHSCDREHIPPQIDAPRPAPEIQHGTERKACGCLTPPGAPGDFPVCDRHRTRECRAGVDHHAECCYVHQHHTTPHDPDCPLHTIGGAPRTPAAPF